MKDKEEEMADNNSSNSQRQGFMQSRTRSPLLRSGRHAFTHSEIRPSFRVNITRSFSHFSRGKTTNHRYIVNHFPIRKEVSMLDIVDITQSIY